MSQINENQNTETIPVQPKGLTVSELVHRHLNNEDDKITDADMDNLQLKVEDKHESHLSAFVGDTDYSHDKDPDENEDEDGDDTVSEQEEEDARKKSDDNSQQISPWDILG